MQWFKHDTTASNDAKLKKVMIKYGLEGYGLYWYLLELIAGNINKDNITFELEHDAEIIAFDTGIHVERVSEMMILMVKLGLFENTTGVITCLTMAKRLDKSMASSPEIRKAIGQIKDNCDEPMTPSAKPMTPSAKPMQEQNRIDKNRIDKDIVESPAIKRDVCPYKLIVNAYHETLSTLAQCQKLTSARKASIKQRYVEDLPDIENWKNYFDYVSQSDFLMGRLPPINGKRVFKADLEWLCKAGNYAKVLEEKYHGV